MIDRINQKYSLMKLSYLDPLVLTADILVLTWCVCANSEIHLVKVYFLSEQTLLFKVNLLDGGML